MEETWGTCGGGGGGFPDELEITLERFQGTGNRYQGGTVLADLSGDLQHDGAPSLAAAAGELLLAWTKDSDAAVAAGSRVVVASWTGAGWAEPVEVDPPGSFARDAAVVFKTSTVPLVLWSRAPAAGITLESTVEELEEAVSRSEMYFSRRAGGVWSAPAPLAILEGSDDSMAAAADGAGRVVAAWLHTDESGARVFASLWDGSGWSAAAPLTPQGGCQTPSCAFLGGEALVAWAQDTDGDLQTPGDVTIFYSTWDGDWSAPEALPKKAPGPGAKEGEGGGLFPFRPPEHCCECPEGDPLCEEEGEPEGVDQLEPDPGQTDPAGEGSSDEIAARDPNEKRGPAGSGAEGLVAAGEELAYTIFFENQPSATAPAQEVFVTDAMDPDLDWSTLRLREVAFGDRVLAIPGDGDSFYTRESAGPWWLDISAELDPGTGVALWTFRTLDPETEALPLDPTSGFLPPNCAVEEPACDCTLPPGELDPACKDGRGEGRVTFTIRTRPDLPAGARVQNRATIVFDLNEPIRTNEVVNTVGELSPEAPSWPRPADGAQGVAVDTLLEWADAPRAVEYDLYLWLDGEARPAVPEAPALLRSDLARPGTLAHGTSYRWQVIARGSRGDEAWGPEWRFTTRLPPPPPPGVPEDPSPPDGAVRVPLRPRLDWADAADAVAYSITLWPQGTTKPEARTASGLRSSEFTPAAELLPGAAYRWQVSAWNTSGETEGPVWSFTTARTEVVILRGDCDGNGRLQGVTDAVRDLRYCFAGADVPCLAACDADGDGDACTGVNDGLRILIWAFRGGPPLPAPFPECGVSRESRDLDLGCERSDCP